MFILADLVNSQEKLNFIHINVFLRVSIFGIISIRENERWKLRDIYCVLDENSASTH